MERDHGKAGGLIEIELFERKELLSGPKSAPSSKERSILSFKTQQNPSSVLLLSKSGKERSREPLWPLSRVSLPLMLTCSLGVFESEVRRKLTFELIDSLFAVRTLKKDEIDPPGRLT